MWHRTGPRYICMLALALVASAACGDDDVADASGKTWVSVAGRGGDDRDAAVRAGRSGGNDADRTADNVAGGSANEAGGPAREGAPPAREGAPSAPTDAGSVNPADLSDAEIASITLTLQAGELERAMLAKDSARRSEVQSFARRMVVASSDTEQRENALYVMLSLEPADNPISMQLRASSARLHSQLLASPARDFDALYLAGLETSHENALSLIARMQNSASRPEIAGELAQVREDVIAHLTEARQILSTLPALGGPEAPDDAGAEDAGE